MLLNRIETDISNTKKIIQQTKLKRQELQQKQASYRNTVFTFLQPKKTGFGAHFRAFWATFRVFFGKI